MRPLWTPLIHVLTCAQARAETTGYTDPLLDIPYHAAVGFRAGASWLSGHAGAAYGSAATLGVIVDIPFGPASGFTLEADQAVHRMVDPTAAVENPSGTLSEGAMSGSQRHIGVDAGFRFGFDFSDPSYRSPNRVLVLPWLRIGGGVGITDSAITLAGFEGQTLLRTKNARPIATTGFGLQIRIPPRFQLQPQVKTVAFFGVDPNEIGDNQRLKVEFRVEPTIDLLVSF
jgi:hypothetical protein